MQNDSVRVVHIDAETVETRSVERAIAADRVCHALSLCRARLALQVGGI